MNPQVLSSQSNFFITFIASFLIWLMFFGVGVLWFIDGRIKKEQALHAIFAIIIGSSIVLLIKNIFPTQRPYETGLGLPLTITIPNDSSFPSSHAAVAFALATSIYFHNKKAGLFFFCCAFLVAWGRVLSNVHSMPDILVGAIIGVISANSIRKLHLFKALS